MSNQKPTSFRWTVCALLFFATTVNYLDRQVLSLTWKDFIAPEFHWTNSDYGNIAGIFTFVYSVSMLISGRLVDWFDTKKGYAWAIIIWSIGAILHAFTGIATSGYLTGEWFVTFAQAKENIALIENTSRVINVSVVLFIIARA
ncbi:MFS transporter, partial [Klebsiella pneumoniae]